MERQIQTIETVFREACERQTASPSEKTLRRLKTRLWLSDFLSVNPRKINIVYTTLLIGGAVALITMHGPKRSRSDKFGQSPRVVAESNLPGTASEESIKTNENRNVANTSTSGAKTLLSAAFIASVQKGCVPLSIQFSNASAQASSWHWDFGDGNSSDKRNPEYTYTKAGNYAVTLTVKNEQGQKDIYHHEIIALTRPVADFDIDIDQSDMGTKNLVFRNKSEGGTSYSWNFGDGQTVVNNLTNHTYADFGVYKVHLIARADNGCADTALLVNKFIEKDYRLTFPVNFRPNPADRNNGFYDQADAEGSVFYPRNYGAEKYELNLFAPNGLKVFTTTNIKQGWNGYIGGRLAPSGSYFWTARGIYPNGKAFDLKGTVKVISQEFE
jgi:hypothetical protein